MIATFTFVFLPRCIHCTQRGLAMRKLSVCPSVCLSNASVVTKRKKDLSRFLYHTKDHLAYCFCEKKNGWWGVTPFYLPPLERNRRFSVIFASPSIENRTLLEESLLQSFFV